MIGLPAFPVEGGRFVAELEAVGFREVRLTAAEGAILIDGFSPRGGEIGEADRPDIAALVRAHDPTSVRLIDVEAANAKSSRQRLADASFIGWANLTEAERTARMDDILTVLGRW